MTFHLTKLSVFSQAAGSRPAVFFPRKKALVPERKNDLKCCYFSKKVFKNESL